MSDGDREHGVSGTDATALELDAGSTRDRIKHALFREPKGDVLRLGRYVVLRELGRGGMGVVFAAYDEELDRRVAVKLLHRDLVVEQGRRIRREAQALAKLSHPHVVQVYDVGEHRQSLFVAMEFVPGVSLAQWQEAEHSVEEIIAMYCQAGQGLNAAHRAGLVHRDFKPANALVGKDDGRIRVLDFGLAHASERLTGGGDNASELTSEVLPGPKDAALLSRLTASGTVMGTPAYMAPEQQIGEATSPATDQFSFCVALYEALYGERPFPGDTPIMVALNAARGVRKDPPPDTTVPTWVREVVLRGLQPTPSERWGDMAELVQRLSTAPPERRRNRVVVWGAGALILTGAGAAVVVSGFGEEPSVCATTERELDGIWDEASKERVRAGVLAVDVPLAAQVWARVEPSLDGYAAGWLVARREVCRAYHEREDTDADEQRRRVACLSQGRQSLRSLVEQLAHADPATVATASAAVRAFPPYDQCEQATSPTDAQTVDHQGPQWDALYDATALHQTGKSADALRALAALAGETEAETDLRARIDLLQGEILSTSDPTRAREHLSAALRTARLRGAGEVSVIASSALARLAWRAGNTEAGNARRDFVCTEADLTATTTAAVACAELECLAAGLHAGEPVRVCTHALAEIRKRTGERSLQTAGALQMRGDALARTGDFKAAQPEFESALSILAEQLGENNPALADVHTRVGDSMLEQYHAPEALEQFDAAIAIFERSRAGDDFPARQRRLSALVALERYDEAHTEVEALLERTRDPIKREALEHSKAVMEFRQGRFADARPRFAATRDATPATSRHRLTAEANLLVTDAELGQLQDGVDRAESILQRMNDGSDVIPRGRGWYQYAAARGLWPSPEHRARARQLVAAALRDLESSGLAQSWEYGHIAAWSNAVANPQ